jgi:signal transduction histidine kinase/CheY-like chemotaxis protein
MPPPPRNPFGSALAIIMAFFTGRLRQRFFADVREYGEDIETPRIVAAGYVSLAASFGLLVGFLAVLIANPRNFESLILQIGNAAGCLLGFYEIRRRRDPRPMVGWLVISFLVMVGVISFRNSGILAPVLWSVPAVAAITALYLTGNMQRAAVALLFVDGVLVVFTSRGLIGTPTIYSETTQEAMTILSLGFASICLASISWLANLQRDYTIAQLKAANTAIVESSARSRIALEAARVGLWDVPNAQQRKFHVTESFQSITGYTAEEFDRIFGNLEKFVHPEDVQPLREAFAIGRKRLSRLRVDFRLMTKTRGFRWFSARAKYSRNEDGTTRISGSLQDINFIKAAEEALRAGRDRAREANQAKSDFIAVMSHEVRTPLNAILGSVEVLKRRKHEPATAELVGLIDDAGRGLLAIVNDLLDVSKIEAGKLEISPSATDISALVTRSVDFWRAEAMSKGIRLEVDCSQAGGDPVLIDAGRVRQIVGNLISNAVKFTDEGSVTTTLVMKPARDGRADITLTVSDTGPGVPDAIAETIFAPFEQGPMDSRRGGAGLGLFISRRLARLMGGDLRLHPTTEGKRGARFQLHLTADTAAALEPSLPESDEDPAWSGRKVLCVDDNAANRRIAELLLARFGVTVTPCASGPEALDLCGMQSFDVILMDIVMPGMDGIETLKNLRADAKGLNQATPAIALTAKLAADDLTAYASAGFDGVAGKPINIVELASAIAPFMVERGPVQLVPKK